jgi:hypothetical protein
MQTGKLKKRISIGKQPTRNLGFSPDGKQLAVLGDTALMVFDLRTGGRIMDWMTKGAVGAEQFLDFGLLNDKRMLLTQARREKTGSRYFVGDAFSRDLKEITPEKNDYLSQAAISSDGMTMATFCWRKAAISIWNLEKMFVNPGPQKGIDDQAQLERWWDQLASPNVTNVFEAIRGLISSPAAPVGFLNEHVKDEPIEDIDELIRQLDHSVFKKREAAFVRLEALGVRAEASLKKVLPKDASPEVRRRVELLLKKLEDGLLPKEQLQLLRTIEVLEGIGTAESCDVLERISKIHPADLIGDDSRRSIKRLRDRMAK